MSVAQIIREIESVDPHLDTSVVDRAYAFAERAHQGQKRSSGEPYITHPTATALTLAKMRVDLNTIAAGLLHDVPDDTPYSLKDIETEFGPDIANLVRGVGKLGKLKFRGVERYVENLRKMFIAMARDMRVVLIKFADRLHNLKTLDALPEEKRERVARETLEIYAPIAHRLQMGDLHAKLEDISFQYLYPTEYQWLQNLVSHRRTEKERYLEKVQKRVERELTRNQIPYLSVHGRAKHLYSLYRKLLSRDRDITKIYDLVALRIIVKNVQDCYACLGLLHNLYRPLKGRIKDYIAQQKPNGYQSLHTTVFCDDGEIVELQIRTEAMHQEAEFGITAHWNYEERGTMPTDKRLRWVRDLLKFQRAIPDNRQVLDTLRLDIFQNRIFVFTPKGDVIELPEESTPIDFAYHIHTEIGNKCNWAKVNDEIAPLETKLHSGDVIEIFMDRNRKGPSVDWLKFVKTTTAKQKIKAHTKQRLFERLKNLVTRPTVAA
jgi:GTP pyrophosphokinase